MRGLLAQTEPVDGAGPVDAEGSAPVGGTDAGDGGGMFSDLLGLPDVGGLAGGLVKDLAGSLLSEFFSTLSEALASAAEAVNAMVFELLGSSTVIDLGSLRGGGALALTSAMGVTLVLAFFFAAIIRSLVRGEYSGIARAALVDVPLAIVGTVGVVTFAQLLLSITDAATAALLGDAAGGLGEGYADLALVGMSPGMGLLLGLMHLIYIVAALLTWMWLVLRSALVYFVVAAAPIGIATRAFPPAAVFARRTVEMGVALIVSKFFLAVALSVGADAFAASTAAGELGGLFVAAATMVLAALMPSVVLRLIPIAEGATAAAGVERAPLRMAVAAGSLAVAVGAAAGGSAGGAGGAGASGTAGPGGAGPSGGSGSPGSVGSPGGPGGGGGSGTAGSSGADGGAGTNGASGVDGSAGSAGAVGSPGPAGRDGVDGAGGGGQGVETRSMSGAGIGTISGGRSGPASGSGSFGDL